MPMLLKYAHQSWSFRERYVSLVGVMMIYNHSAILVSLQKGICLLIYILIFNQRISLIWGYFLGASMCLI